MSTAAWPPPWLQAWSSSFWPRGGDAGGDASASLKDRVQTLSDRVWSLEEHMHAELHTLKEAHAKHTGPGSLEVLLDKLHLHHDAPGLAQMEQLHRIRQTGRPESPRSSGDGGTALAALRARMTKMEGTVADLKSMKEDINSTHVEAQTAIQECHALKNTFTREKEVQREMIQALTVKSEKLQKAMDELSYMKIGTLHERMEELRESMRELPSSPQPPADTLTLLGTPVSNNRLGPSDRPAEFDIRPHMGKLGLEIDKSDGKAMRVEQVLEDGAISDWNSTSKLKVKPGDRIIAVDRHRGPPDEILGLLHHTKHPVVVTICTSDEWDRREAVLQRQLSTG
mmetsp:Transcript_57771/g.137529  ORF Transcript_57771/g.137529 Transcript_57771/m.137529 type:complete len:340 (+) Transcript_57771:114-1133(+)|eukprot:CAMPEP_0178397312 /NCGR_PEP_ID=MMETSP0689_2-20121128/14180_1 /TAXON_ID=160604 /ORGANISM="Amphidinium massartii, Strain CS-259" /LENGTH=339 /DNA_ID=CAMNT_0020018015 /DNA_START=10 /DNA_END=1029 /DNA_ORIENTATION=-